MAKVAVPIPLLWSLVVIGMNMKAQTLVERSQRRVNWLRPGGRRRRARTLVTQLQQVVNNARETMPGDMKD